MRIAIFFLLSCSLCHGAVRANGLFDFKTTKKSPGRQTLLFAQLTNQSQISMSVWVKFRDLDGGSVQGLVSKGNYGGGAMALQLGLHSNGSEKLCFSFSSPPTTLHTWATTSSVVQTNSWMHIGCSFTYSNASSMRYYINGTSVAGSWTVGTGNAVGQTNAHSLHTFIYQTAGSDFFAGSMADLAIWTNTVTAGEFLKLGKSRVKYMPIQIQPSQLLFYWPMDTKPVRPIISGDDNIDRDRSSLLSRFDFDAGGLFYGEKALSYQANE